MTTAKCIVSVIFTVLFALANMAIDQHQGRDLTSMHILIYTAAGFVLYWVLVGLCEFFGGW